MNGKEEGALAPSSRSLRRPSRPSGATVEWGPEAETHLAGLWTAFDAHAPEAFRRLLMEAVSTAPEPIAEFELAGVHDSFGEEQQAEPRYRRALELGLDPDREAQCRIQLASTLRNLGRADEGLTLLRPLLDAGVARDLAVRASDRDDRAAAFAAYAPQARGFAALCLASLGRDREAVRMAVDGIGASVTRYSRSLTGYAAELPDG